MTEKELHKSACLISEEMNKFNKGKACNFGFITDDSQNFRVFSGGFTDNIAYGIAIGLVNLCTLSGQGVDYIQGIANTAISILNSKGEAPVQ